MQKKVIEAFAKDYANISKRVLNAKTSLEISKIHHDLNEIGANYRQYFCNKGHYKAVKRAYVRQAVFFYEKHPKLCCHIGIDLALDILRKVIQGWIPIQRGRFSRRKKELSYELWYFLYEKVKNAGYDLGYPQKDLRGKNLYIRYKQNKEKNKEKFKP